MAQKRMLNKSISLSRQVNSLNLKNKLIFTWCIPHLDDFGLIERDASVIKAMVCPMVDEIKAKDILSFIAEAISLKLIKEHEDCLEFEGFENHQSLSAEKRSKSKFSKIPKNPQEIIGENNNPQKSPVQEKGREDKGREVKIREGKEEISTPKISNESFFELLKKKDKDYEDFVCKFSENTGVSPPLIKSELKKFFDYWTEKNKSGTKEKWELETTFEVQRRLSKWFTNAQKWSKEKRNSKYQAASV